MGGRFRTLLPSDLFRAGACARESLPAARGADYANPANKAELKRLMRRRVARPACEPLPRLWTGLPPAGTNACASVTILQQVKLESGPSLR